MPSISSFIQYCRDKWTQPLTKDTQDNDVKRRGLFIWTNSEKVEGNGDENAFPQDVPVVPPGPSYDLMTRAPEPPSLPIYESFTSMRNSSYWSPKKCDGGFNGAQRQRHLAAVAQFQAVKRDGSLVRGSAAPTQEKIAGKAPAYDRAIELAKMYQSLLPDFHALFEGDDDSTTESERNSHRLVQSKPLALSLDGTAPRD
ncbi:uncharacterized protein B0H64DRAFT_443523 [Chaetomium fimeti]|uniref:Uncharacterized protein n=1 Tax=Chaetomium fimeti TaxID=1854472 RepID=A0AAE0HDC8_9PEZI|nr:hypothetical protein B0H64DRAFT_443523 [Chaetomium fimeti]